MKRITFYATVDEGIDFPEREFQKLVKQYLNSPNGWVQDGYTFAVSKKNPHVHIRLSSSSTIHKICGLSPSLSCAELGGHHMYLNARRWLHGAPKSGLNLNDYRQYMVSHEIGHILGHEHEECRGNGRPAPIMLQQTLGLHGCAPNTNVKKK